VRRYFVKVRMKIKVAQQSVSLTREFEVKMVPSPRDIDNGPVEAGPSNSAPPPPYSSGEVSGEVESHRE
jgi:hypothetical protein